MVPKGYDADAIEADDISISATCPKCEPGPNVAPCGKVYVKMNIPDKLRRHVSRIQTFLNRQASYSPDRVPNAASAHSLKRHALLESAIGERIDAALAAQVQSTEMRIDSLMQEATVSAARALRHETVALRDVIEHLCQAVSSNDEQLHRVERALHDVSERVANWTHHARAEIADLRSSVEKIDSMLLDAVTSESAEPATSTLISIREDVLYIGQRVESLASLENAIFRQYEASKALQRLLDLSEPLPYSRGWAASPDLLLYLHKLVRALKPNLVVELGSGTSTLVLADALRQNRSGQLHSFDHDVTYQEKTLSLIRNEGLLDFARVQHAELTHWQAQKQTSLGETWNWYDSEQVRSTLRRPIELLFIDGPPSRTGPHSRYPAVPALIDMLAPKALIIVDDMVRPDDISVVRAWSEEFGLELNIDMAYEKGVAILEQRTPDANRN